ncbi:asparagine synthase-related protein [Streptomyces enissocaesilis]
MLGEPEHPEFRDTVLSTFGPLGGLLHSLDGEVELTPDFGKRAGVPDLLYEFTPLRLVDGSRLRGRHRMHQRSSPDVKPRPTGHLLGDHGDRMTTADPVEGRHPFLDLDFVRVTMEVTPDPKSHDLEEEHILKRAVRGTVPTGVAEREKFPLTARSGALLVRAPPEFTSDWLSSELVERHGVFGPDEVGRLHDACRVPGHRPPTPLRTDWLMIVLTFTILREQPARADRNTTPCRTPVRLET